MDPTHVEAIDTYPFRERLGEVMRPLPPLLASTASITAAAEALDAAQSSAIVVADEAGRAAGLITERDVVRSLARHAADLPAHTIMTRPIAALPADARLYKAIARMERLGLRHLGVEDRGTLVGLITPRQLLRRRASGAFALADLLDAAPDASSLRTGRARLPRLAQDLRGEDMTALDVADLLAETLRDTTRRAAELVEHELGPPPGAWCVLILGSGGRGETLLGGDQDNAIIHAPGAAMADWCAAAGDRLATVLDEAGVPLCKGGVMASNPAWRGDLATWTDRIEGWWRAGSGDALLDVDIFYDAAPVHGDLALGTELKEFAVAGAATRPVFLRALAQHLDGIGTGLGWFGGLRTDHGLMDLKRGGSFPIVAAVRTLSLRHGITATGTRARLDGLVAAGTLNAGDGERLAEALEVFSGLILDQQIRDLGQGLDVGTKVAVDGLNSLGRTRLKEALRQVDQLTKMVAAGLVI
jgi:signal-transduction protein with cAMP-binding, CBS, and nucleotidyltransferase domain